MAQVGLAATAEERKRWGSCPIVSAGAKIPTPSQRLKPAADSDRRCRDLAAFSGGTAKAPAGRLRWRGSRNPERGAGRASRSPQHRRARLGPQAVK